MLEAKPLIMSSRSLMCIGMRRWMCFLHNEHTRFQEDNFLMSISRLIWRNVFWNSTLLPQANGLTSLYLAMVVRMASRIEIDRDWGFEYKHHFISDCILTIR